jgi:hypothetical protein
MFVPYLWWSIEILFYLPPFRFITPVMIAGVAASTFIQKPFGREIWKRRYRIAILQFVCYPATLLVAATGAGNGAGANPMGLSSNLRPGPAFLGYWYLLGLADEGTSVVCRQRCSSAALVSGRGEHYRRNGSDR